MSSTEDLKTLLKKSLAESKADPNPGYVSWQFHPAGNERYRNWRVRESRRRRERRELRRKIRAGR